MGFFTKDKDQIHSDLKKIHDMKVELKKDARYADDIERMLENINAKMKSKKLSPKEKQKILKKLKVAENHADKSVTVVHGALKDLAESVQKLDRAA